MRIGLSSRSTRSSLVRGIATAEPSPSGVRAEAAPTSVMATPVSAARADSRIWSDGPEWQSRPNACAMILGTGQPPSREMSALADELAIPLSPTTAATETDAAPCTERVTERLVNAQYRRPGVIVNDAAPVAVPWPDVDHSSREEIVPRTFGRTRSTSLPSVPEISKRSEVLSYWTRPSRFTGLRVNMSEPGPDVDPEPDDVAEDAHPTRGDAATPMVMVPPPSASRDTGRGHAGRVPLHSSRQLLENTAREDAVIAPCAQKWLAPSTDADTWALPGSATLLRQ